MTEQVDIDGQDLGDQEETKDTEDFEYIFGRILFWWKSVITALLLIQIPLTIFGYAFWKRAPWAIIAIPGELAILLGFVGLCVSGAFLIIAFSVRERESL